MFTPKCSGSIDRSAPAAASSITALPAAASAGVHSDGNHPSPRRPQRTSEDFAIPPSQNSSGSCSGRGATFDLYPNAEVAKALEHFWAGDKVVGAICHGAIALGNIPDRVRGRRVTGYTLEGDQALERLFGSGFLIPHYPQTVLEEAGTHYTRVAPNDPLVVIDGKLVTGQNQQSASEYALVLLHAMTGSSPVTKA